MSIYADCLRSNGGYKVELITNVDGAFERIAEEAQKNNLQLVIMMPPGDKFKDIDTDRGRKTGEFIYREIRRCTDNS